MIILFIQSELLLVSNVFQMCGSLHKVVPCCSSCCGLCCTGSLRSVTSVCQVHAGSAAWETERVSQNMVAIFLTQKSIMMSRADMDALPILCGGESASREDSCRHVPNVCDVHEWNS